VPTPAPKKVVTRPVTPEKKSGNWFTNLFSIFDSSESEPYTIVIPTQSAPKAPEAPKAVVPAANPGEQTLDDVLASPAKPASSTTPAAPEKPKNGISIEMEPYDDTPAKK
jgi:hypothetical protein